MFWTNHVGEVMKPLSRSVLLFILVWLHVVLHTVLWSLYIFLYKLYTLQVLAYICVIDVNGFLKAAFLRSLSFFLTTLSIET